MPTEFDSRLVIEWPMEPGWPEDLYEYLWRDKVQNWIMSKWQEEIAMADMFEETKTPGRLSVHLKVAETIKTSFPTVFERTAQELAEEELDKRTKGFALLARIFNQLMSELNKMKPDVPAIYDEAGTEIRVAGFSKAKLDEKAKLIEKLKKAERAVKKAEESNDFSDVYNWNNSNTQKQKSDGKTEGQSGGASSE